MDASIGIGSIRGIRLGIHYSWFIVLIVFSYLLSEGQFPNQFEGWTRTQYWVVGVATVILLFASVLVHELAHSVVAQTRGIEVVGITLFIFGGVAQLSEDSDEPGEEFAIAIAGPLASLGLAGLFGGLWYLLRDSNEQIG
ncbi:MAG: peptidase, partial [Thermomicrobiales bacterium]|nr:peptidase [Thermomicrobiales bacterium]